MQLVVNSESKMTLNYIAPLRGLVCTHDAQGREFDLTALQKWIRLNRTIFKVEKVDFRIEKTGWKWAPAVLEFAAVEGVPLSLRVENEAVPASFSACVEAGIEDVLYCHSSAPLAQLQQWVAACKENKVPLRIQLHPPFAEEISVESLVALLETAVFCNITLYDPFVQDAAAQTPDTSAALLKRANALAAALRSIGVDVTLTQFPFCWVEEDNWPAVCNEQQFFLEHMQYQQQSYEFASKIHLRGPHRMAKAVENLLGRKASLHGIIDRALLPWVLENPRIYARVWMFHKLTRHLNFLRRPRPLPQSVEACEAALEGYRKKQAKQLGVQCSQCRFQRICDHAPEKTKQALPGLVLQPKEGPPVVSPMHYRGQAQRYFDALDAPRCTLPEHQLDMAQTARQITLREAPTREIPLQDYGIEDHFNPFDDASKRWYSFANTELQSTPLTRLEPPFTIAFTAGGGIAQHVGFSFGRHTKIVCPMIDYTHRITLHVDRDGYFVLLRDGVAVRPAEFEGAPRLPVRLAGTLEPRIAVHNVDGFLLTQTILVWEGENHPVEKLERIKYSVVIVSTRYSRRLQATLLSLAHQHNFDMSQLEVIIAYVPGIDGNDDLIDCMQRAYPHLRIVRSPFEESNVRSKGFMINESARVASGEWVMLLDSDTMLPPDMFEKVDAVAEGAHFIAPDGRKMLTPDQTADILLGKVRPWEHFDEYAASVERYRFREGDRIPCGFCQCVRKEVLEKIPYHELDHFEASDWLFGRDVVLHFGKETRLEGTVVLHLDHEGRQWYGTLKHM